MTVKELYDALCVLMQDPDMVNLPVLCCDHDCNEVNFIQEPELSHFRQYGYELELIHPDDIEENDKSLQLGILV